MQMLTRHGPISSWTLPNTDRGASCKERKDLIDMTHTQIYIYMCHTNYLCNAVWTYLRKTYKTFSLSHSWSQIQSPPQQWHASSDQTSCRELPGKKTFWGFQIFQLSLPWCFLHKVHCWRRDFRRHCCKFPSPGNFVMSRCQLIFGGFLKRPPRVFFW